eukprot:83359_1
MVELAEIDLEQNGCDIELGSLSTSSKIEPNLSSEILVDSVNIPLSAETADSTNVELEMGEIPSSAPMETSANPKTAENLESDSLAVEKPSSSSPPGTDTPMSEDLNLESDSESSSDSDSSDSDSSDSDSSDSSSDDDSDSDTEMITITGDLEKDHSKLVELYDEGLSKNDRDFVMSLPSVERLEMTAPESANLKLAGFVSGMVDGVMLIRTSEECCHALEIDSVLFGEDRQAVGKVYEVLGQVTEPMYTMVVPEGCTISPDPTTLPKVENSSESTTSEVVSHGTQDKSDKSKQIGESTVTCENEATESETVTDTTMNDESANSNPSENVKMSEGEEESSEKIPDSSGNTEESSENVPGTNVEECSKNVPEDSEKSVDSDSENIREQRSFVVGQKLFFVKEFSEFVLPATLDIKGTDAEPKDEGETEVVGSTLETDEFCRCGVMYATDTCSQLALDAVCQRSVTGSSEPTCFAELVDHLNLRDSPFCGNGCQAKIAANRTAFASQDCSAIDIPKALESDFTEICVASQGTLCYRPVQAFKRKLSLEDSLRNDQVREMCACRDVVEGSLDDPQNCASKKLDALCTTGVNQQFCLTEFVTDVPSFCNETTSNCRELIDANLEAVEPACQMPFAPGVLLKDVVDTRIVDATCSVGATCVDSLKLVQSSNWERLFGDVKFLRQVCDCESELTADGALNECERASLRALCTFENDKPCVVELAKLTFKKYRGIEEFCEGSCRKDVFDILELLPETCKKLPFEPKDRDFICSKEGVGGEERSCAVLFDDADPKFCEEHCFNTFKEIAARAKTAEATSNVKCEVDWIADFDARLATMCPLGADGKSCLRFTRSYTDMNSALKVVGSTLE